MATKLILPRSMTEIRQAAITPKILKASKALLEEEERLHKLRDRLKFPTDRLAVVEEFFGAIIKDMPANERGFAEAVAIAHQPAALVSFSEDYIGSRINGLPCQPLIKEFNSRVLAELETELANVEAWLDACYSQSAGDVNSAPSVEFYRHRIFLTRNAAESGQGGSHGIRSMISGLT
jgi:hypothetical protein